MLEEALHDPFTLSFLSGMGGGAEKGGEGNEGQGDVEVRKGETG